MLYARPRLIRSLFCIMKYSEGAVPQDMLSNMHSCVSATCGFKNYFAVVWGYVTIRVRTSGTTIKKECYRRIIMIINFAYIVACTYLMKFICRILIVLPAYHLLHLWIFIFTKCENCIRLITYGEFIISSKLRMQKIYCIGEFRLICNGGGSKYKNAVRGPNVHRALLQWK